MMSYSFISGVLSWIVFCKGDRCATDLDNGIRVYFCCNNSELRNGQCMDCLAGYFAFDDQPCKRCRDGFYGHSCNYSCQCENTQRCNHVNGCIIETSTEAFTNDDPVKDSSLSVLETTTKMKSKNGFSKIRIFFQSTEGIITGIILLLCVPLICVCCKYKISCQKRNQSTCCSDTLQFSESVNSPQQGETHEYEEVAVDLQNRESSMNSAQDVSSSSSLTGGSGICGTDSDGYLNPYHTPKSTSITLDHGPYSELSNTETSFMHVLESPVYSKSQTQNLEVVNRDKRNT